MKPCEKTSSLSPRIFRTSRSSESSSSSPQGASHSGQVVYATSVTSRRGLYRRSMNEQFADIGPVTLCYETFGDPSDPAMLLIMGLGTQMVAWREDFCRQLADRGFFVIRYDNRDSGKSTSMKGRPITTREMVTRRVKEPAYTLEEMADDAVGLLDHLGIEQAHVVGALMGGMIAQHVALRYPGAVLSLAS